MPFQPYGLVLDNDTHPPVDVPEHQNLSRISEPVSTIDAAREIEVIDPGAAAGGRFRKQQRIEIIDDAVDKIYEAMNYTDEKTGRGPSAADMRNISIAIGVLVDKRRLEEGLSTSNTETHSTVRKVWSRRTMPVKGGK